MAKIRSQKSTIFGPHWLTLEPEHNINMICEIIVCKLFKIAPHIHDFSSFATFCLYTTVLWDHAMGNCRSKLNMGRTTTNEGKILPLEKANLQHYTDVA